MNCALPDRKSAIARYHMRCATPPSSSATRHPMPRNDLLETGISRSGLADRLLIRELVENWALYRDAGDWERFRSVWHDDGRMMATWCQADADGFIKASQQGWEKGVSILHFL